MMALFFDNSPILDADTSGAVKPRRPRRFASKVLAFAAITGLATSALVATVAAPALADTTPPATPVATSAPASVDALPTAQIDGVAWSQVIVGNTVYVGGSFANARPAGSAAGTGNVARANMLAYNLTTGVLSTSFAPVFNAQVRQLAASPDGTRLYAVGNFTTVNGETHNRVVAFNTATGAIIETFAPGANGGTNGVTTAVAATNDTVYVGGSFTALGKTTRTRVAAMSASTGAVLPLTATIPDNYVRGIAVSPDHSKIVIGGDFTSVNGSSNPGYGLAALDATSGASLPWAVNGIVRDATTPPANANDKGAAGIYSITGEADGVYGTGFVTDSSRGNLEGTFKADWNGNLIWVEDCHGDTYSVAQGPGAIYTASHSHMCDNVGGFPQTSPTWTFHRGLAWTIDPTNVEKTNSVGGYYNWGGTPAPTQYNWYPDINTGTYTGQSQGPWSVAGNSQYVVYGGEFTKIGGVSQQGLVRFAARAIAPNKSGPRLSGADFALTATSPASDLVQLSWPSNYDLDDEILTYTIIKDGDKTHPIATMPIQARFYQARTLSYADFNVTPGSSHTYRIAVTDPIGNLVQTAIVPVTVSTTGAVGPYGKQVFTDGATDYWRLDDATGSTSIQDWAGQPAATASSGVTLGQLGAMPNSSAAQFSGDSTGLIATPTAQNGPQVFSIEAWFKTNSTGKIIGFGDKNTGTSSSYDRHLYVDGNGKLAFGVYPGFTSIVNSSASVNDGTWHYAVGTLDSTGQKLYLDGLLVGSNPTTTSAQSYSGYWRLGGDSGWSGNTWFTGTIDDAAVYGEALTSAQVQAHYQAATGIKPNYPPVASFTPSVNNMDATFDGSASSDPDGTIASYAWNFGDGQTGTGSTAAHTYTTAGTYTVSLTVTDDGGLSTTTTQSITAQPANVLPTASFTTTANQYSLLADASASQDSDGSIASYAWNFGDGGTGSGVTASHVYANPGSYVVTLVVTDNRGGTATTSSTATVTATGALGSYGAQVLNDGAASYWRLDESPGASSVKDWAGNSTATAGSGVTFGRLGAKSGSSAALFSGDSNGLVATNAAQPGPQVFSVEAWFQTTGTGKIVGFGNANTGTSNNYDRHLYIDSNGALNFGVYPGFSSIVTSPGAVNDGNWHYAVGTLSSAGQKLYLDGSLVASRTDTTSAQDYSGYWRIGGDNGWSGSTFLTGSIDDVAIYRSALTAAQVQSHYTASMTSSVNTAPTAAFGSTINQLAVTFDASASADPDGSIASYAWDFGDGNTGSGVNPTHNYTASGTYGVVLTVTDDKGAHTSVQHLVTVVKPNVAPTAAFTATPGVFSVAVDGSASTDSDGTIAGYAWNFGDGGTATGKTASHVYTGAGTYTVSLTVTDDQGATASTSSVVTVSAADVPPVATIATPTVTNLTVAVDGSGSTDSDGTISSYAWTFGDGGTATGATATHTYAASGTYTVKLTVTDNQGASTSTTTSVTVTAANVPPVAVIATPSITNLSVALDGSGSTDSDGTIASYAWTFGDTTNGIGKTTTHTYTAAGTYTVTLTVTDDKGATATTTASVTVAAPPSSTVLATDTFTRNVSNAWGTADAGGAWTTGGAAANFSVSAGTGRELVPTGGAISSAYLPGVSSTTSDITTSITTDKPGTGGGITTYVVGRRTATNNEYRGKIRFTSSNKVNLSLTALKGSAGEQTLVSEVQLPTDIPAGATVMARMQVTGTNPTTIKLKAWFSTQAEPTAWNLTTTDTFAGLQAAGAVGLTSTASSTITNAPVTVIWDNFSATTGGTVTPPPPPANVAPTASFTATASQLTANVNGSASADSDGTIASYAWNFGDGGTATGATASHVYTAGGTFTVKLTVTDNQGATGTSSQQVTVTAPPPPAGTPFAQDAFERTVANGWGPADVGGAWTTTGTAANFSISGGTAREVVTTGGQIVSAYLPGVSSLSSDVTVSLTTDKPGTGGGITTYVVGRRTATNTEYRGKIRFTSSNRVNLSLTALKGSAGEQILLNEVQLPTDIPAGATVMVRMQVSGTNPTTIKLKAWFSTQTEPTAWNLTTTDTYAGLQAAGSVGLTATASSTITNAPVTIIWDNFAAVAVAQ